VEDAIGVKPGTKGENIRYDEWQVARHDEQIGGHGECGKETEYCLLRNEFILVHPIPLWVLLLLRVQVLVSGIRYCVSPVSSRRVARSFVAGTRMRVNSGDSMYPGSKGSRSPSKKLITRSILC
jgi:hypothetical protein